MLAICAVEKHDAIMAPAVPLRSVQPTRISGTERFLKAYKFDANFLKLQSVQRDGNKFHYVIPLMGDAAEQYVNRQRFKRPEFYQAALSRRERAASRGWTLQGSYVIRYVTKTYHPKGRGGGGGGDHALLGVVNGFFFPVLQAAGGVDDPCGPPENVALVSMRTPVPQGDQCTTDDSVDYSVDFFDDGNPYDAAWTESEDSSTYTDDGGMAHFTTSVTAVASDTSINTDESDPNFGDFDITVTLDEDPQLQTAPGGSGAYPGAAWVNKSLKTSKTWHGISCADQTAIGQKVRDDSKVAAGIGAVIGGIFSSWTGPGLILGVIGGGATSFVGSEIYFGGQSMLTCFTDLIGSSSPAAEPSESPAAGKRQ
jgi:hypothetical protein